MSPHFERFGDGSTSGGRSSLRAGRNPEGTEARFQTRWMRGPPSGLAGSFNARTTVFEHSSESGTCRASVVTSAALIPSGKSSLESSSRIARTAAREARMKGSGSPRRPSAPTTPLAASLPALDLDTIAAVCTPDLDGSYGEPSFLAPGSAEATGDPRAKAVLIGSPRPSAERCSVLSADDAQHLRRTQSRPETGSSGVIV